MVLYTHTHTHLLLKKEKNTKQFVKINFFRKIVYVVWNLHIKLNCIIIKIKGTKAFTLSTKNMLAIKNNCLFKVQKNIQGKLCKSLT